MSLIVNLFAGPGTGKSTTTALVFGLLKLKGINSEIVHEYAKDLVWEDRSKALKFQPYILGKQMYHVHRLIDQVDVIVTDSPILLSPYIYGSGKGYHDEGLRYFAMATFKQWNTLNIFLRRNNAVHPYKTSGRLQNEDEAREIDLQIEGMLRMNEIPFFSVGIEKGTHTAQVITYLIEERMHTDGNL